MFQRAGWVRSRLALIRSPSCLKAYDAAACDRCRRAGSTVFEGDRGRRAVLDRTALVCSTRSPKRGRCLLSAQTGRGGPFGWLRTAGRIQVGNCLISHQIRQAHGSIPQGADSSGSWFIRCSAAASALRLISAVEVTFTSTQSGYGGALIVSVAPVLFPPATAKVAIRLFLRSFSSPQADRRIGDGTKSTAIGGQAWYGSHCLTPSMSAPAAAQSTLDEITRKAGKRCPSSASGQPELLVVH